MRFDGGAHANVAGVVDAEGSFATFGEAFPDVDCMRARAAWPELFDGQEWVLPFRAYRTRAAGATVLVDTGIGPSNDFLPGAQGLLPLAVDRDSVDVVVLTHLHVDHIGWATVEGEPYFRYARYVVAAEECEAFGDRVGVLDGHGVLAVVDGECEVAPGVRLLPTPGHTPGHVSVLIDDSTLVLGDVAVHPCQFLDPDARYAYEVDSEVAARTRRKLLERVAGARTVVAAGHFPSPFGRVRRAANGFRYEPC
jgi:glyoxylase-like metal-dependent hydrolase (beta-lactamase superfamily II)